MRYYLQQPRHVCEQWWRDLYEAIPGNRPAVGFSNEMHAFLFSGDTGGAAVFTFLGSLAYNWGTLFFAPVAFLIGGLVQQFTIQYIRSGRTVIRTVIYFAAGMRLALSRDPYTFLLNGFISLLLFYWIFVPMSKSLRHPTQGLQSSPMLARS